MKKGKNGKNLKEKVLFLMCLGALAGNMSAEIYAQENPENNFEKYNNIIKEKFQNKDYETNQDGSITITYLEKEKITDTICIENIDKGTEKNPININLSFDDEVKINNFGILVDNSGSASVYENITAQFNEDLFIDNKINGYALYGKSNASGNGGIASIIIGQNNKNTIKIIGNMKVESVGQWGKAEIKLNLNNDKSFFAGKIETTEYNSKSIIEMKLKNEATWYAHRSNVNDTYTVDGTDENLRTEITSNGGVIDIYHYSPGKTYINAGLEKLEQLEVIKNNLLEGLDENSEEYKKILTEFEERKKEILEDSERKLGGRTFTLNGVGDRLQNTTFRISSDVEKGKADKIVLNGIEVNKDKETYYIEIAADPFESGEWKSTENDKILVMDINAENSNINDLNKITVEGKECEAEIGAGLVKQKIIPTVEEDTNNKGDWYLTAIDKIESKGSGHIFAEIGAAANAGMASAWRTDSGDLYQRMGNLRNNEAEQGVWGRIYTGENEVRKGISLDLEYRAVQVGYDCKENIDNGKLFTGIAFGYFDGNADYDHGSGESNSATLGVYATYSGNNGSFGDFIVKLGNIDNKLSYTSESGDYYKTDYDTYGFSADGEYGYRYEFNNDYYIEPLAQLSYIYIADEEYTMNLNGESGAKVSNDDYQSLIGYTGFHYGKKFDDSVVYLRVAAAHEFAGDIDVNAKYQDIKVNSSISGEDTWVEYGVGFDVKVKEDTAVYGRVQRTTGDVVKNKWHASVGLRYTF